MRGSVLTVVALCAFLTTLDTTIVVLALPAVQEEFGLSTARLAWVPGAYTLAFAACLVSGGRLADVHGRRTVLVGGLLLFTAASLMAAASPTGAVLIAGRAVQGVGSALVLPAALAVVMAAPDQAARDRGAAVWMASLATALAAGPVVGGLITQFWHWSGIFWINLPLGAGVALLALTVPESRADGVRPDLTGMLTCAVALGAAAFALLHGQEAGWAHPAVGAAAATAVLGAALFVLLQRRSAHPMLDLALLRARAFRGGTTAQVLWGMGVNGAFFFVSLFLQRGLGLDPSTSGLMFLPIAALLVVCSPLAPAASARFGPARTVAAGLTCVSVGLACTAVVAATAPRAVLLLPGLAAIGAGSALTVPLTTAVLSDVPEERVGVAGGVFSTAREASGLLGIGLLGVLITLWRDTARAGGASPAVALTQGYAVGLGLAAVLVAVGAAVAATTLPGAPDGDRMGARGRLAPDLPRRGDRDR